MRKMWVMTRFPEGLPWVEAFKFPNPERVEYHILMKEIQPLQGCDFSVFLPRVDLRLPHESVVSHGASTF